MALAAENADIASSQNFQSHGTHSRAAWSLPLSITFTSTLKNPAPPVQNTDSNSHSTGA